MTEIDKNKRIRAEYGRMKKILRDLDKNKLKMCDTLIERAAFLTVELQDLEEKLKVEGWTEEYQNGAAQRGVKKSADAEVHISLTKNLSTIMKQLLESTPAARRKSALEEMMRS